MTSRGDVTFTLAHLSDPHLTSLDGVRAQDLANKRVLGYLSWRRRRRRIHRRETLDAVVADLHAHAPQHIAITGDLTHVGLPSECAAALDWLHRVGPSDRVSLVPGNHDRYVAAPDAQTVGLWRDYFRGDDAAVAGFPFVRRRGEIALIGVDTAVPTAPFLATGRVGADQLRALAAMLDGERAAGRFRVVLLHHSPLRDGHARRKRLTDAGPLTDVLIQCGAELLIHGHGHEERIDRVVSATGPMIVVAVPSASNVTLGRAGWNAYRISREAGCWALRIEARRTSADGMVTRAIEHVTWAQSVSRAAGSTSR
jgi:3',5'-cyclic AMP phosphodiesterase CpdA